MNLRISRTGAVALVASLLVAAAIFIYLMGRFGGPSVNLSDAYEVSATIPDTQGLAVKSEVLVRGVKVGEVQEITDEGAAARVKFAIQSRYAPLGEDATVRVGQKTLLGESFVDLDRGHVARGRLADGAELASSRVQPTVEIDEALASLGPQTRAHMRSLLASTGEGAVSPGTNARVDQSVEGLARTVDSLHKLSRTLRDQRTDIAGTVQDSRVVLRALGSREAQLRAIVSRARRTLEATASSGRELRAGMTDLPDLLASTQRTLSDAQPLLKEARPLVANLANAAPALTPALEDLRPVARSATRVIDGLGPLNGVAVPFLRKARPVVDLARPVARGSDPAIRNLVSMVAYLSPRKNTISSWFANTGDLGLNGDTQGSWARFFIFVDPMTAFGRKSSGVENNAYTSPDDAASNRSYGRGGYPRLRAYEPGRSGLVG
jgi:phospholipid/cholesterol/gamma-HCH transport system substrate-binding protein